MSLYSLRKEARGRDLVELGRYEYLFDEYDEGVLKVRLKEPLTQQQLDQLQAELEGKGVHLIEPVYQYLDPPELVIHARKEQPWLAIAALALLALGGGIALYWWIYKPEIKPNWTWVAGGISMAGVGAGLSYYGFSKSRLELALPGLGLAGGGIYLSVREFMPKPAKQFKNVHTKYATPVAEGDWVATGDFKT